MGVHFEIGDRVLFNYRSARDVQGTIVGIERSAKTVEKTMYQVQPDPEFIHPGERVPVHRSGAHLRHQ
jgi:hypothetical protein